MPVVSEAREVDRNRMNDLPARLPHTSHASIAAACALAIQLELFWRQRQVKQKAMNTSRLPTLRHRGTSAGKDSDRE